MSTCKRLALTAVICLVGFRPALAQTRAPAQEPAEGRAAANPSGAAANATPFVPAGHWSLDAARRLEGAGLAEAGFDPGTATVTVRSVARIFRRAAEAAGSEFAGPETRADAPEPASAGAASEEEGRERTGSAGAAHTRIRALAAGYRERLREEFPGVDEEESSASSELRFRWLGGAAGASYVRGTDQVRAGEGYWAFDWTGVRPLADVSRAEATLRATAAAGRHLAFAVSPSVGSEVRLAEGHGLLVLGPVRLWGGRRAVRFGAGGVAGSAGSGGSGGSGGPGGPGGLVAGAADAPDPVSIDGGGLSTDSFRLPWLLRFLGPVRVESHVSRLESNAGLDRPWLTLLRARVAPHPRLAVAVNHGAMLVDEGDGSGSGGGSDGGSGGGGGSGEGSLSGDHVSFWQVLAEAAGLGAVQNSPFDNRVVSVEARFRPPLGGLPLVVYAEWGSEDSSGGFHDVPGGLLGLELAAVPGMPELSVGLEAVGFAESCCGNPKWYRHGVFREGWTDRGRLFAHPLGGHGHEIGAFGRLDAMEARLRLRGRAFLRQRRSENLYAPEREGGSVGFDAGGSFRLDRRVELSLSARVESGERDWQASALRAGLRWLF